MTFTIEEIFLLSVICITGAAHFPASQRDHAPTKTEHNIFISECRRSVSVRPR
jgi:hypothetical protein